MGLTRQVRCYGQNHYGTSDDSAVCMDSKGRPYAVHMHGKIKGRISRVEDEMYEFYQERRQ